MSDDIAGVLLAGGLGRRMGGDKALVRLAGRPLIQHAAARLGPQVGTLIVNANGDPARFAALGLPAVADETADFPGPLAGVLAALHWIARERPGIRAVASVSADAPFIPSDLVSRLEEALRADKTARVAVAQSRGQRHHVIGLWRVEAAGEIAAALARGERRAEAMVDRLGAVAVPFADVNIDGQAVDPFFNVNTPEDLAFAETVLARISPPPCGEGSGVGGVPTSTVLESPPPWPSPTRGEGKRPFVVGVAGWKNSGKTTLVARLVAELVGRGYRVSTVKHSHHDISGEAEGTDSARHRQAGAQEVALVSPHRWAVIGEARAIAWREEPEPPLAAVVAHLAPVDIVIVEGLKRAAIPKIEVRRRGQGDGPPLADGDPAVFAIAADHEISNARVPVLALDDVAGVADALLRMAGLEVGEALS
jgi:molybdenum cofactor guanylyltransferase/molybdopterin-guanine dinucleotide biosynthesis protein MobB